MRIVWSLAAVYYTILDQKQGRQGRQGKQAKGYCSRGHGVLG